MIEGLVEEGVTIPHERSFRTFSNVEALVEGYPLVGWEDPLGLTARNPEPYAPKSKEAGGYDWFPGVSMEDKAKMFRILDRAAAMRALNSDLEEMVFGDREGGWE